VQVEQQVAVILRELLEREAKQVMVVEQLYLLLAVERDRGQEQHLEPREEQEQGLGQEGEQAVRRKVVW
jgi:hypothetical protein